MRLSSDICKAWALLLALIPASLQGQVEQQRPAVPGRSQPFYFDAMNFAQFDEYGLSSRIDIYVQIPFDLITFVRTSDGYVGAYTITAVVSDEEGKRLREETWTRKVERSTFEGATNPNTSDLTLRSISLEPGPAIVEIYYEDKESSKEYRLSRRIDVRKFDRNLLGISDLMLVSKIEEMEGKRRISPHVNPNVAMLSDGVSVFYEIYNPFLLGELEVTHRITKKQQVVMEKRERQSVRRGLNTFVTKIGLQEMGIGAFDLELTAAVPGDSTGGTVSVKATRPFIVEWLSGGAPLSITDLDEAIEQLRYFAKSGELSYIREPQDEKERRRRFEEFWERNNPAPGSSTNRAMVEYYTRIAYANANFGHYIAGWKTDRGMVYIIYGPPNTVDRHPLDVESKPYEIWEYYELNRRFVFVDESGFGDYRLLYPIWDDRNRIR